MILLRQRVEYINGTWMGDLVLLPQQDSEGRLRDSVTRAAFDLAGPPLPYRAPRCPIRVLSESSRSPLAVLSRTFW